MAIALPVCTAIARYGFNVDPATLVDALIIVVPLVMSFARWITTTPIFTKSVPK